MMDDLYVDLRSWACFDVPGRYEVDCTYQGTRFFEDNPDCEDDERAWDFVLTGKVGLTIVEV